MLWLLTLLALAQDEVPDGKIVLRTSPTATVEMFPRVNAQTIELAVHENAKPLDLQLEDQRTAHVEEAWAASTGGGTWFVTLYVDNARVTPTLRRESATEWTISTEVGDRPVALDPVPEATVSALIANTVPRRPRRPPPAALHPLRQDAWTPRLDPREVGLPVDPWMPRLKDVPRGTPSMQQVDTLRLMLADTDSDRDRTAILQHLALTHERLGMHREARAYFDRVAEQQTEWPQATVRLHQANASLATARWEDARTRCGQAHRAGAEDAATLACLARVSLATGSPAPTPTARALLKVDQRPAARLTAAQLLVSDSRFDEALPLLSGADDWTGDLKRWRDATLGDVAMATGDVETARRGWRDVGTRGELGRIATQRSRLIRLLNEPPNTWGQETPALARDGEGSDAAAAEAHYVAAQIARAFDEPNTAALHLTELVDRWPTLTARSDIPQMLLQVCERRLAQLQRRDRLVDQVAFYYDCWRPELNGIIDDTSRLQGVGSAMTQLGLWESALTVQRDVAAILTRDNRERMDVLVALARTYVEIGRHKEALQAVTYAERRGPNTLDRARLAIIAGDAHLALGEADKALSRWAQASRNPTVGAQARIRRTMTLAEQGRCDETVTELRRLTADPDQRVVAADEAKLNAARCLLTQGQTAEALALATAVAVDPSEPAWATPARWIAAATVATDPELPIPEGPASPEEPWVAALAEMRRADAVRTRASALEK